MHRNFEKALQLPKDIEDVLSVSLLFVAAFGFSQVAGGLVVVFGAEVYFFVVISCHCSPHPIRITKFQVPRFHMISGFSSFGTVHCLRTTRGAQLRRQLRRALRRSSHGLWRLCPPGCGNSALHQTLASDASGAEEFHGPLGCLLMLVGAR